MGKEGVKKRLGEWENWEEGSIKEAGRMVEEEDIYVTRLHLTQQEVNGPLLLLLLLDIPPAGL